MKHRLIKLIAIMLTAAMLWQDVAWACPDGFCSLRPVAMAEKNENAAGTNRQGSIFLRVMVITAAVIVLAGIGFGIGYFAAYLYKNHSEQIGQLMGQAKLYWSANPSLRAGAFIAAGVAMIIVTMLVVSRRIARNRRAREAARVAALVRTSRPAKATPAFEFESGTDKYGRTFIRYKGKNYYAEDIIGWVSRGDMLGLILFDEAAKKYGTSEFFREVITGLSDAEVKVIERKTKFNVESQARRIEDKFMGKGQQLSIRFEGEVSIGLGKSLGASPCAFVISVDPGRNGEEVSLKVKTEKSAEVVEYLIPYGTYVVTREGKPGQVDEEGEIYRIIADSRFISSDAGRNFCITVHRREDQGWCWLTVVNRGYEDGINVSCDAAYHRSLAVKDEAVIATAPAVTPQEHPEAAVPGKGRLMLRRKAKTTASAPAAKAGAFRIVHKLPLSSI